jgi:hypothetical protein
MVPNFRMPLSTNGCFPQNETGSPITTYLYLWTHINQLSNEIKLLFVSIYKERIDLLVTRWQFPPKMLFGIENALAQGYQILVEHILVTGRSPAV